MCPKLHVTLQYGVITIPTRYQPQTCYCPFSLESTSTCKKVSNHTHTHTHDAHKYKNAPWSLVAAAPNVEEASTLTLPRHPPSASCCSSRWGLLARDAPLPLRPLLLPMSGNGGKESVSQLQRESTRRGLADRVGVPKLWILALGFSDDGFSKNRGVWRSPRGRSALGRSPDQ